MAGRLDEGVGAGDAADAPGVAVPARVLPKLVLDAAFWAKRDRELTATLPLWPWQVEHDIASVAALIDTLEKALKREADRIRSGRFAGDGGRHWAIQCLLRRERQICKQLSDEARDGV